MLETHEDPNAWRAEISQETTWQSDEPPEIAYPAPEGDDPWSWWTAALDDRFGLFDSGKPQQGFYRCRPKMRERGQPVCIWYDAEAGQWFAQLEGGPLVDVGWCWYWSHKHPIRQELHDSVIAGGAWPEEIPAIVPLAGIGHNSATDEEIALDAIRQLDEGFTGWLASIGGAIVNEEQDATAEGYRTRMVDLRADIAERHKTVRKVEVDAKAAADALKKAADDRLKLIDDQWKGERGPITIGAEAAERISAPLSVYRTARAEKRKLAAEAAREARAAVAPELYGAASNEKAATRLPATTVRKPKGGRTAVVVKWTDRPAFVAQLMSFEPIPPDLAECLEKIARRMLDAKAVVHGAEFSTIVKV